MKKLDKQYPVYDFAKNKGYGTAHHLNAPETIWLYLGKSFKGVVKLQCKLPLFISEYPLNLVFQRITKNGD